MMLSRWQPVRRCASVAAVLCIAGGVAVSRCAGCRAAQQSDAADAVVIFGQLAEIRACRESMAPPLDGRGATNDKTLVAVARSDMAALHRTIAERVLQHHINELGIDIDHTQLEARAQQYVSERNIDRAQLAWMHAGELVEARFALDYHSGAVSADGAAAELLYRIGPLLKENSVELPELNDDEILHVLLASFPNAKAAAERLALAERCSPEVWALSNMLPHELQWEAVLHRLYTSGELAGQVDVLYEIAAVAAPGDEPPRLEVLDPVVKLLCLQLLEEKKIKLPASLERDYRAYLTAAYGVP